MRFKKGSKVEVFSNKEGSSGSWHRAEIIRDNGHNYIVRYDTCMGSANTVVVERLPRKAIRPLPPLLASGDWVPRDAVEVYDNLSWKIATVLKALRRKYYLVRLVGSAEELRVHESDIRARQIWKDGKWVVVGKESGNCKDGQSQKKLVLKYRGNSNTGLRNAHVKFCVKNECHQRNHVPKSQDISSKTLKRVSPYGFSQVDAYARPAQKYRAIEIEKDGVRYKAAGVNTSSSLAQSDAIPYPREMLGKKSKHASNNRISGFSNVYMKGRPTEGVGRSMALNVNLRDDDRIMCSVGSCSATSTSYYKFPLAVPIQDSDDHVSDAESVCPLEHEEGNKHLTTREDLGAEVHKLELHAYRCTIEALHAAGPLSWEQEVILTNLRVSLNISDDEHLMEGQSRKLVDLAFKVAKVGAEFIVLVRWDVYDVPLVM